MRNMSVEELEEGMKLVINSDAVDLIGKMAITNTWNELLRRYEALEKELESWRGSRDGVLQHIDEMSYEIESLKCCGNCKHDNDTPTDTAEDHYCYDCENNNKWEKRL